MHWGVRNCPLYLEPLFILGYTVLFFLICRGPRRAVASNLAALAPGLPRAAILRRTFRVFWNFAWSCADGARAAIEGDFIDWEVTGREHFDQAADAPGGVILLTAHMGSYDVAAPLFAGKFHRPVVAVRAPERTAELQEIRQAEAERVASEAFRFVFNTGENFLAVDLLRALHGGEAVALQGDRLLPGLAPIVTEIAGRLVRLPKGPFALALASGAPIHPLFIIRLGRRRYQIRAEAPIVCRREGPDARPAMQRAAGDWARVLESIARAYWYQWFVFEPLFPEDAGPSRPR